VVNCSTPANYFHALRRQMVEAFRKPMAVIAPKALLRHPACVSRLEEMEPGTGFRCVIGEPVSGVRRVVLCTGKIFYYLDAARGERGIEDIALVRLEQLYPFPLQEVSSFIEEFPNASEVVWCQEEPQNQGAWYQIRHHLQACVGDRELKYAGRESSASPAVGYYKVHLEQQKNLVHQALTGQVLADTAD